MVERGLDQPRLAQLRSQLRGRPGRPRRPLRRGNGAIVPPGRGRVRRNKTGRRAARGRGGAGKRMGSPEVGIPVVGNGLSAVFCGGTFFSKRRFHKSFSPPDRKSTRLNSSPPS